MTDVSQFSADGFDPQRWINAACAAAPPEETLERHLAGLEMRLALAAEDLEAALEEASDRALRRIPAAAAEATTLQDDVAALQREVKSQVADLGELRAAAARSTGTLAALDGVKTRMEAACSTLKEATELSELFARVETVFAGGDVAAMAALLARMRASLALVGHVPEFAGGLQRLNALEDRFQALVEGSLAAAFSERRGDQVAQLAGMMAAVGRDGVVQKLYISARTPPIQVKWDSFDPSAQGGFLAWLPGFYGTVEGAAESEARWLGPVLPDQAAVLVAALLIAVFTRTDKSFRMRLTNAVSSAGDRPLAPLSVLLQLHGRAVAAAHQLVQVLSAAGSPWQQLRSVASAAYLPFEAQILKYGDMEARQLAAELAAVPLPEVSEGSDVEAAASALAASTAPAVAAVQAALQRTLDLTGGTGLLQLLAAADAAVARHGARQAACLSGLHTAVMASFQTPQPSGGVPPQAAAGAEAGTPQLSDEGTAALPLLSIAGAVVGQLGVLDAKLRAAALALAPTLEQAAALQQARGDDPGDLDPADPVPLRLLADQGSQLRQLQSLVQSAGDSRYTALPSAAAAAASFQDAADSLVYSVLMVRVQEQLGGLAEQPVWAEKAKSNEFGLPSFSAYPGPAVVGAGEYLLMLPQLLEGALDGAGASGDGIAVDGDWLDKVASGAAELYAAQLGRIGALSQAGATQAAADAEYFCNVLSALGLPLPAPLATWQLVVALPPEEFAAADTTHLHAPTVAHIARARGLAVPGTA